MKIVITWHIKWPLTKTQTKPEICKDPFLWQVLLFSIAVVPFITWFSQRYHCKVATACFRKSLSIDISGTKLW